MFHKLRGYYNTFGVFKFVRNQGQVFILYMEAYHLVKSSVSISYTLLTEMMKIIHVGLR